MTKKIICKAEGCDKESNHIGFCGSHYARYKRHGDPLAGNSYVTGELRKHPSYSRWDAMMQRCYNPNNEWFKNYGGRGIGVCERWQRSDNFLEDMGEPTADGMTLERLDTNGDYSPQNCTWADRKTQSRNRRCTKLTMEKVREIRARCLAGEKNIDIAADYGVAPCSISNIKSGRIWQE